METSQGLLILWGRGGDSLFWMQKQARQNNKVTVGCCKRSMVWLPPLSLPGAPDYTSSLTSLVMLAATISNTSNTANVTHGDSSMDTCVVFYGPKDS